MDKKKLRANARAIDESRNNIPDNQHRNRVPRGTIDDMDSDNIR